jgi:hypothetical protein
MAYVKEHGYQSGVRNLPQLYTDDLLRRADDHLSQASAAAGNGPEIYRRRVDFVRAGLEFSKRAIATIRLMDGYWNEPDAQVADRARDNWEQMQGICEENPYAINWGPVRPTTPRMLGLHPDHPNPKWERNLER